VIACASGKVELEPHDKSTTDNATESNNRMVLLIPIHPSLVGQRKEGCQTSAP
jgi:hypothetical protein